MDSEPSSNPIEMEFALNQLSDKNEERRRWAEQRVRKMSPAELDRLMVLVKQEGSKRKRRRKIVSLIGRVWLSLILIMCLAYIAHGLWTGTWGDLPDKFIGLGGIAGIGTIFLAASNTQKNAARALAIFDHTAAVGVFAEALYYEDIDVAKLACEALIRNLPSLTANDCDLLNDEQRKCLHRSLYVRDNGYALGMAILAALEQVGDDRDLAAVKKLSVFEAATSNQKKLREEAIRILPGLEQRAELSKAASTLLRATSSPYAPEASLLRPAAGVDQSPEGLLLRPLSDI